MADAAPAARGVDKPRRPQASPRFRLVSDHLHRLQTVCDERFAREYGPWRPVVAQVVDKFLALSCTGFRRGELSCRRQFLELRGADVAEGRVPLNARASTTVQLE